MKSLDEFNKDRLEIIEFQTSPHPNGIECPECGGELWDSNPTMMLMSHPARMSVHCPICHWAGSRVA